MTNTLLVAQNSCKSLTLNHSSLILTLVSHFSSSHVDIVLIFVSFLVTRDRMGRLNTFMARILKDIDAQPPALIRGVGVDEHTALLLDVKTGDIQAVGVNTAYVCSASTPAAVCKPNTPLTFQNLECVRLSGSKNDKFSFATLRGDGVSYTSNIVSGKFTNIPYGPTSTN